MPIAVVEAKPSYATPGQGLQQAKDYAEILGLRFAYATNGHGIVEFDYTTGMEREIEAFPTPDELWERLLRSESLSAQEADRLLTPAYHLSGKSPRYYQEIAINRTVQAVLQGRRRILLTMATGTGKTVVAFQICWKLWSSRWNRTGGYRRPRILYLADRNILVDDPMAKTFTPFGDARWKIEGGVANKSREMYFAIYQAIAHGAFGIVPGELDGAIATNDFPTFEVNEKSASRSFLSWLSRTQDFVQLCRRASEGTTNRVRLKESRFLDMPIPLPDRKEQDRIVVKLDALSARIDEARECYRQIEQEGEALCRSLIHSATSSKPVEMSNLVRLRPPDVEVKPDAAYEFAGVYCFGRGVFKGSTKTGMMGTTPLSRG